MLPTTRSLAVLLGLALSIVLSPAFAATRVPTVDGKGTVTVDVAASVYPAPAADESIATPVPHAGGGVITTTRTGDTRRTGTGFAPLLAAAPSLTVTSSCAADSSATITIADAVADMPVPFTWRLSLNGTPIAANAFQLNAGQALTIHTAGLFGTLKTDVLDASNAVVASGSAFCPTPPPPPPPAFTIGASCDVTASGTFVIANAGSSMTVPFTWRLSLNGTPVATNSFQLAAAQATTIRTSGLFGALTLDILNPSGVAVASAPAFCQSAPASGTPAFDVVSACAADASGSITITDAGASMAVPFTWRLSLNGTPIASGGFQLNASQSTSIHTAGLFGTLTTDILDTSGKVVASGAMFCPTPPPPPPPAFTVGASCAADGSGTIAITNVGSSMTVPFTWRLSRNGTPIASSAFQLNAAQSSTIRTSGIYGTLVLDVVNASNAIVASASMLCMLPGGVVVPDVVGMTLAAATSALTSAGLAVGTVTTANSSTVPAGSIISENPAAGSSVPAGSAVSLVVSNGLLVGDVNGDGVVDCADLAIVKASFGKRNGQVGFDPRADVNHDGVVNIVDLSIVAHALPAGTVCP
jgi:hypothetical protein